MTIDFNEINVYLNNYVENCREIVERVNNNNGDDKTIEVYNSLESKTLPFHMSMLLNKRYSLLRNSELGNSFFKDNEEDDFYDSNAAVEIYCDDECNDLCRVLKTCFFWDVKHYNFNVIKLLIDIPSNKFHEIFINFDENIQVELFWIIELKKTTPNFYCYIASFYNRLDLFEYLKEKGYNLYSQCWRYILSKCNIETIKWCINNIEYNSDISIFIHVAQNEDANVIDVVIENIRFFNGPYLALKNFKSGMTVDQAKKFVKYNNRFPIVGKLNRECVFSLPVSDILFNIGLSYHLNVIDEAIFRSRFDIVEKIVDQTNNNSPKFSEISVLSGNIDMVKFIFRKGFKISNNIFSYVAYSCDVDIFIFIREYLKEFNIDIKPTSEAIYLSEIFRFDEMISYFNETKIVKKNGMEFKIYSDNDVSDEKSSYLPDKYLHFYKKDEIPFKKLDYSKCKEIEDNMSSFFSKMSDKFIDYLNPRYKDDFIEHHVNGNIFPVTILYHVIDSFPENTVIFNYLIDNGAKFSDDLFTICIDLRCYSHLLILMKSGFKPKIENLLYVDKELKSKRTNGNDELDTLRTIRDKMMSIHNYKPYENIYSLTFTKLEMTRYKPQVNDGVEKQMYAYDIKTTFILPTKLNNPNLIFVSGTHIKKSYIEILATVNTVENLLVTRNPKPTYMFLVNEDITDYVFLSLSLDELIKNLTETHY